MMRRGGGGRMKERKEGMKEGKKGGGRKAAWFNFIFYWLCFIGGGCFKEDY